MAPIPGSVRVTGFFATSDSTDTYAVTDSKYNRGGYREVADLTERDAITSDRRRQGMMVYVQSNTKIYILQTGVTNSDWVEFTGTGSGTVTIPNTQIPFGDATNSLTSSSDLTYNNTAKYLQTPGLVLPPITLGSVVAGKLEHSGNDLYYSVNATDRYKVLLQKYINVNAYDILNWAETRSYNAQDTNFDTLVNLVGTLIQDLKLLGIIN